VSERHPAATPAERRESVVAFLKDNLEAIAVAVVMALVIKHFCVEAFKIPTGSMKPTLMGKEPGDPDSEGDRILVDKFAFLFEDPDRWDVIVFRYPLDQSRNFIKRIAGLPNEHLRISEDGDLWVRPLGEEYGDSALRIPQKPRHVREQFYRAVYPPVAADGFEREDLAATGLPDPRANLARYWRVEDGPPSAWRLESHRRFVFTGGARAVLRNAPRIRDLSDPASWALSGDGGELVRDVRFRFQLRLESAGPDDTPAMRATRVTCSWFPDDEFQAALTLGSEPGASRASVRRGTAPVREQALDVALAPGRTTDVELEYVDGMLRVHLDGEERAVLPDGRRFADTRTAGEGQRFTLAVEGAPLTVDDLRIDRDLRYVNDWTGNPEGQRQGVDVPDDSYFMLGDNTRNSSDSRRWRLVTTWLKDGRTIRRDSNGTVDYLRSAAADVELKQTRDAEGILRTWAESEEDGERGARTEAAPFVHRDLVVGRAFLVFWPCLPDFPGRLGFIH
jgi:signal peptidase I